MEYRILGLSGLRVSAVGLGCMGMSHAYGEPVDKREMKELLTYAVRHRKGEEAGRKIIEKEFPRHETERDYNTGHEGGEGNTQKD